jgi:hypothetical protein
MKLSSDNSGTGYRLAQLATLCILGGFHAELAIGQEHDGALKQRFLREAPVQWEEYARRAGLLQGKIIDHLKGSNFQDVQHLEYKNNGKGRLFAHESKSRQEDKEKGWDKEVYGSNPKYAFHLRRSSPGAPWTLLQLVDLRKEDIPDAWTARYDTVFGRESRALLHFDNMSLAEMVRSSSFSVNQCSEVQAGDETLIEVSFSYDSDPSVKRARPDWHFEGKLRLDPNRYWCLRSAEFAMKLKDMADAKYGSETRKYRILEIGATSNSLPVPKLIESDGEFPNCKEKSGFRSEFDLDVPRRLPADEEFTLTAFGLPEPPGLEWKRPTPWYLWLGLAGIVCLAAGVAIRKLMQRKTAQV